MTVEEIIKRDHGNACILFDWDTANGILQTYQDLLDAGEYDDPDDFSRSIWKLSPEECAAREAYNALRKSALHMWMTSVARDDMLATITALSKIPGIGARVEYLPGESLWYAQLASEWSEHNPDEPQILMDPMNPEN